MPETSVFAFRLPRLPEFSNACQEGFEEKYINRFFTPIWKQRLHLYKYARYYYYYYYY